MKILKRYLLAFVLVVSFEAKAENAEPTQRVNVDGKTYLYQKPSFLSLFRKVPEDLYTYYDETFVWENWPGFLGVGASTAGLIYYDQPILEEARRVGEKTGVEPTDQTTTFFNAFGVFPIRFPSDLGSSLYFIGDGWTHATIAATFYASGYLSDSMRAMQVGTQIIEGIVSTGIVVQTLKHITGRESPVRSTSDGGVWRFFPDQVDYHKHVSSYDAYPSGHIATTMVTVTVIADNYPEYGWIRPVGYGFMSLLGFQMLNNGVHWASDYPLGIALGYGFAKIAVKKGRTEVNPNPEAASLWDKIELSPILGARETGLRMSYKF